MRDFLNKILSEFKNCAFKAGNILLSEYKRDDLSFREKIKRDFVSETDLKVEEEVKKILEKKFKDIPFLGEEMGKEFIEEGFICDPLDGTRNFIQKIPIFSFSIAYVKKGEPLVSLIYVPFLKELFYAIKGGGAYLNDKAIRVSNKDSGFLIGTGFPFRKRGYWEIYYKKLKEVFENSDDLRRPGSASQDLAYVACGRYDGFFEFGLSPWDVIPGVLLVEEAGGKTSDMQGTRNHLISGNIIAGNPFAYNLLLKIFLNNN
ncbi:MAG: inositol monophosphatase family protein [Candidatus Hydrothermales bacterium]